MSVRKDQFAKEYPKEIIPPQMMAVSVTLNFKSGSHELTSEETPIYLTTPNMLPALVSQFLKVRPVGINVLQRRSTHLSRAKLTSKGGWSFHTFVWTL